MKSKKILSWLLALTLAVTQFSLLGFTATAQTSEALTGRSDFAFGVNIHTAPTFPAYTDMYTAIKDAKSLGANMLRVNYNPSTEYEYGYFDTLLSMAEDNGMDVMLVIHDGFYNRYVKDVASASEVDTATITEYYTEVASHFAGRIDYYQVGNEMDNDCITGTGHGTNSTHFSCDYSVLKTALDTAYTAIKAQDSAAKTVLNFSWVHYGFLAGLQDAGLDWDVTGWAWYSNGANGGDKQEYNQVLPSILALGKDVIVGETGLWPTAADTYIKDAQWLTDFCTDVYNNYDNRVIGFIPYELYDEPYYEEEDGEFNKESHFGLIDSEGNRKDTFTAIQSIYGGTDVDRTIEAAPANTSLSSKAIEVDIEGLETTVSKRWNRTFDDGSYTVSKELASSVDISSSGRIVLDFYVEDYDAFTVAYEKSLSAANNGKSPIRFKLFDTDGKSTNFALPMPTKSGWNRLEFDIPATTTVDRTKINRYWLAFNDGGSDKLTALAGMNLAIANVYADANYPDVKNTYTTIDIREGLLHTRTLTAGQNLYNGSFFKLSSALDTTAMQYVEMDIYVSAMPDRAIKFWISENREASPTTGDNPRKSFNIPTDKFVVGEWNHVAINVTSLKMQGYNFAFPFLENAIFPNGGTIKVANLATTKDCPNVDNTHIDLDVREGVLHERTLAAGEKLFNTSFFKLSSALDTTDMEFVEMDLYVSAKPDAGFKFWISDNREASTTRKSFAISYQDLEPGWNHVAVDVTSLNMQGYNFLYPFLEGTPFTTTGGTIKIANLATTKEAPSVDNVYNTIDVREGVLHRRSLAAGEKLYNTSFFKLSSALDTTDMQFVEMDVYVSVKPEANIQFWISDNRESGTNRKSFNIPYANLEPGWNHVTVDVRSLNMQGYNFLFPFLQGTPFTTTDGTIKIANLATAKAPDVKNVHNTIDVREGSLHTRRLAAGEQLFNTSFFKLSSALDTTDMEFVEMDLYVSAKPDAGFKFWISENRESSPSTGTGCRKYFTISADDLEPGWNHVAINVTSLNMQGYNFLYPFLQGTPFTTDGGTIIIANLATTKEAPDLNNKYTTIDVREGVLHRRSLEAGEKLYNTSFFKLSSALDTTAMQYVEMDVYVSVKPEANIQFWISDDREESSTRKSFIIPYTDLEPGWNHVAIDVTSLNMQGYNFAYPFLEGTPFATTEGTIKIANLATTKDCPNVNNTYTTVDVREGVLHERTLEAGENLLPNSYFKLSSALKTLTMNVVEMDVYVSVKPDANIKFWVSDNRESGTNRKAFAIPYTDLEPGWNHVAIDVTNLTLQGYNFLYPYLEGAIFANGGTIKIANLSTTKNSPAVNNTYTTVDVREGVLHTRDLEAGENLYNESYFKLSSPLDTTDMRYVEMDVYVSVKPEANIKFWISNDRETSTTRKSFTIPTDDFVAGKWNHVEVDVTSLGMEGYNFAYPFLQNVPFVTEGGTIKIANLATTKDWPDVNNTYATLDVREGILHTRTLTAEQNLYNGSFFKLSSALDTVGMQYVEMDIYVSAMPDRAIKFWISENRENSPNTGDNPRKAFDIPTDKFVVGEWNHVAIDVSSLNMDGYNFAYPFLERAIFPEGGTIKIANLATTFASTEVIGDANNDGEVNLRDLVRAKKHYTGHDVFINKETIAFDLEGDVNAEHIVKLTDYILDVLFKS